MDFQSAAIQVCQPGFDVRNCPDWAYLFNSNWPSLTIAKEFTNPVSSGTTSVTHNLGFYPLVMAWLSYHNISYGRNQNALQVSKTQVGNLPAAPSGATFKIECYNIDISQEGHYVLPQSAAARLPYDPKFGIKVAKDGRLITSSNLNDFILHSRAQSPAVLDICTEKGRYYSGGVITYPLRTSYLPWFVGASKIGGNYQYANMSDVSYQVVGGKPSLVYTLVGTTVGSLIVLRDPLFAANQVQVTY